jgi:Protein of unknown function (DUF1579)
MLLGMLRVTSMVMAAATAAMPVWAADSTPPPFVKRGMPGEGQQAMEPLAGDWKVAMTVYIAMGSPKQPVTSTDLVAHREWIAGGRFLRDVTQGTVGGSPYWRMGTLGYSNMDGRYEWVTQDGFNANMMIYKGAEHAGPHSPASLSGTFTDQGVLGERYTGKTIRQRTVITIDGPDHHTIDIYFTPPGGKERLGDHKVYTRIPG